MEISKKQKILGYKIRIKIKSASDEKLKVTTGDVILQRSITKKIL